MTFVKTFIFFLLFGFALFSNAANETFVSEVRYLHVQKGQTLHNIVKRLYPAKNKQWPEITSEIVRLNPHAFINNNSALMKADVRLTLPAKKVKKNLEVSKQVGSVVAANGSVIAVSKNKVSRKLFIGYPVFIGDKVITGEDGFVQLKMIDDAVLDLRCFSIMVIEDYALDTTNRRSVLNLLQGNLRKITGQIGKSPKDVYQLKTPIASVGVRGTEYSLRVFQSKGCGGTIDVDNGLYLEVINGWVNVHNSAGEAVVAKGETVYVPLPESVPKKISVKTGVFNPVPVVQPVPEPVQETVEEETGLIWWIIGIAAIVLLI